MKLMISFFADAIAVANLLYGLLTLSLVVYHFSAVTVIGLGYFSIEISIIVLLAIIELRTAHHPNSN